MMKSVYTKTITIVIALMAFLIFPGCGDDGEIIKEAQMAQEQRYFDLYMGVTFKDTIAPPTESGLFYIEVTEGTGDAPGPEDWVKLNYVGYVIPEDIVVDTYMENVAKTSDVYSDDAMYGPFKMKNGTRHDGLTEGLSMMREGGEAILCYTSDLGYGEEGAELMKSVSKYKSLKYEVQLLEVIGENIESYEHNRMISYGAVIPGVDTIYDVNSELFMYYVIDSIVETGSEVKTDSVVQIGYKGYLLDGRVFDESTEDSPFEFKVGDLNAETSPILGWHLGVARFREGEKGRLIIPYQMAYGEAGSLRGKVVSIPPYETLVFDIEVLSVSDESEAEPDLK